MTERRPHSPKRSFADVVGGVIDRIVFTIHPAAGARRMAIRELWRDSVRMQATFEAAQQDVTRGESWLGSRLSTDSALESDLETARSRSREMYRNDAIGGAVDGRTNLIVGRGFTPQAEIKARDGVCSEDEASRYNLELEEVYQRTSRRICKTGKRSLWQLCRVVMRHLDFDGEAITILADRGDADRPIPLVLDVIDPERLQTPPELSGNPRVRMGVEYDATGKIVRYHIRDSHPGDTVDGRATFTAYPADRVLHVFEAHFAQQSRGLPWMIRTLNRIKDGKDSDEAAIIAQQVQACYAAFVINSNGPGGAAAAAAATGSRNGKTLEDIHPGTVRYLDGAEDVKFTTPSNGGANYGPFQELNLRRIAGGLNWPYEMLAKNWVGLSFAAGRLSLAEARLAVSSQQGLLIDMWLEEIWRRIVFEAVTVGAVSIPPLLYRNYRWVFEAHSWTPPRWPFSITPAEEIKAHIEAVDNNLNTKANVIAELGYDLEQVFDQREKERAAERKKQIEPATADTPAAATVAPQDHALLQEQMTA